MKKIFLVFLIFMPLLCYGQVNNPVVGGSVTSVVTGTGLTGGTITTTGTIASSAESTMVFAPGLLTAVTNTIGGFTKVVKTSTVDNLVASAILFTCVGNPTVTMYECGVSTTCTSPTTIGTVTLTAAGTAVASSLSSPSITAGDYVGFAITSGTCASLDLHVSVQSHSN